MLSPRRYSTNAMESATANMASYLSSNGTVDLVVVKSRMTDSPKVVISRRDDSAFSLKPIHNQQSKFQFPSHTTICIRFQHLEHKNSQVFFLTK